MSKRIGRWRRFAQHEQRMVRRTLKSARKRLKPLAKHLKKLKKLARRKLHRLHFYVARRPHLKLVVQWQWYNTWHSFRWHPHVHVGALGVYMLFIGTLIVSSLNSGSVAAFSTWAQSDWSGNSGIDTSTQYFSSQNIEAAAQALTLSKAPEQFASTNLDTPTEVDAWLGVSPSTINNIRLHTKADAGIFSDNGVTPANPGDTVQLWSDLSGSNHSFVQNAAPQRPTLTANSINGRPSLTMQASTWQTMASPIQLDNITYTVSYVARQNGPARYRVLSAGNNWLLGWWGGGRGAAYYEGWVRMNDDIATNLAYQYTGTGTGAFYSFCP